MGLVLELKERETYDKSGNLAIKNGILGVSSNCIHYVDNGDIKYQKLPDKSIEAVGRNNYGGLVIYFSDVVNYERIGDSKSKLVFSDNSTFDILNEYVRSVS